MHSHLVSVKIGVKRRTNHRMNLDCVAFNQNRLKRLNPQTMQSGRAIQKHTPTLNNFFQHRPDMRIMILNQAPGAADIIRKSPLNELSYDKWLEKFQRHFFWEFRTHANSSPDQPR